MAGPGTAVERSAPQDTSTTQARSNQGEVKVTPEDPQAISEASLPKFARGNEKESPQQEKQDTHPYAKAREQLSEALLERWDKQELVDVFIAQLDKKLDSDTPAQQELAKAVYEQKSIEHQGRARPAAVLAILAFEERVHSQLSETIKQALASEEKLAELNKDIAELGKGDSLKESVQSQLQNDLANDTQSKKGVNNNTELEAHTKSSPQSSQSSEVLSTQDKETQSTKTPEPKKTPTPEIADTLRAAKTTLSFHVSTGSNNLKSVNRDLRLRSDGEIEMRFRGKSGEDVWLNRRDQTTNIKVKALFAHEGKVYDAQGKEVTSLRWGSNQASISHALRYIEPLKDGRLSGVKNGYLKDLQHNGEQVVFTKGPPPGIAQQEQSNQPHETEARETEARETEARETEATKQANSPKNNEPDASTQTETTPQPRKEEELRLPKPPATAQAQETAKGQRIDFDVSDRYGRVSSVPRDLRLSEDGTLQMRFRSENDESVWLRAHDPSRNLDCTCLFHHQGKLYDRSGEVVDRVQWGNNSTSATHILGYVDTLKAGEVSGIQDGYLNDVRHNGQRVVFTEGLPPGIEPKELEVEPSNTTPRNATNAYQQSPTKEVRCSSTEYQTQRSYYQDRSYQQRQYHQPRNRGFFRQNFRRGRW